MERRNAAGIRFPMFKMDPISIPVHTHESGENTKVFSLSINEIS